MFPERKSLLGVLLSILTEEQIEIEVSYMRSYIYRLFTMLVLTTILSKVAIATTLTLAYSDVESYPFQIGNGTHIAEPPGLALDVLNQASNQLEIEINYLRLPGKRVLDYIATGEVDGGFIFSYNANRARFADYPMQNGTLDSTKRIAKLGYYFYKLKQHSLDWNGSNFDKLEDKLIAAHLGFSITEQLKQNNILVHEAKNTEQLFHMLRSKRIDAIAIQDTMAQQYLKDKPWSDQIEQVFPAITTKDYFLIFGLQFSKDNPELVQTIWQTVGAVREDVIEVQRKHY